MFLGTGELLCVVDRHGQDTFLVCAGGLLPRRARSKDGMEHFRDGRARLVLPQLWEFVVRLKVCTRDECAR